METEELKEAIKELDAIKSRLEILAEIKENKQSSIVQTDIVEGYAAFNADGMWLGINSIWGSLCLTDKPAEILVDPDHIEDYIKQFNIKMESFNEDKVDFTIIRIKKTQNTRIDFE